MKVNPISTATGFGKTESFNNKKVLHKNGVEIAVDKYIPSKGNDEKVITYHKQSVKADRAYIACLKEESERAYESLKRLVTELLEKQGYSVQHLKVEELESLGIDEETRIEAANLIAEDGPLGAEAVSNRIVDFALAVCGGDKSKLPLIKGAIEEGFGQVKNMLGGLPEVSLKTYDLIMEKLARWETEEA